MVWPLTAKRGVFQRYLPHAVRLRPAGFGRGRVKVHGAGEEVSTSLQGGRLHHADLEGEAAPRLVGARSAGADLGLGVEQFFSFLLVGEEVVHGDDGDLQRNVRIPVTESHGLRCNEVGFFKPHYS